MNEEQKVELKLIHMEEVVSKEVSWLWYPYIPYGTARSVLLVARLRDKPNIRIMAQDKSSLAPAGDAIGFEMTEDRGMTCIGPYDITICRVQYIL